MPAEAAHLDALTAARAVHNVTTLIPVEQRREAIERMRVNAEAAGFIQIASFDYAASLAELASLAADRAAAQIDTQRLLAAVSVARALGAGWQPEGKLAQLAQAPRQ